MRATVTQIGNSTGVILPKEAVARLKVKKGDSVFLTETPDGYSISPYDPEFEAQMAAPHGAVCPNIAIPCMSLPRNDLALAQGGCCCCHAQRANCRAWRKDWNP